MAKTPAGWPDRGGRKWFCDCLTKGPNCRPAEPCPSCLDPRCRTEHNLGLALPGWMPAAEFEEPTDG